MGMLLGEAGAGLVACQALPSAVAAGPLVGSVRSHCGWLHSLEAPKTSASPLVDWAGSQGSWLQSPGHPRTGSNPLVGSISSFLRKETEVQGDYHLLKVVQITELGFNSRTT